MKNITVVLLLLIVSNSYSQNKTMCITVDDLPIVSYGIDDYKYHQTITNNLLKAFKKHNIAAIGYVNEGKLYHNSKLDTSQVSILEMWLESGFELGNHTYSHMNYHKSTFQEYTSDIIKGERVSKQLSKKYNQKFTYFRHPYLRSGLSKTHSDSLKTFLKDNGYIEAPITIDNEDYLFAKAYHNVYVKKDTVIMRKVGDAYIKYMEDKLLYFENISNLLFARNISQTLLVHASLLNSEYIDELIEMYQSHGYAFISQTEVLKDQAYNEEVSVFRDWGISWLERWALSKGKKGSFFRGDPSTPEFIKELNKL